MHFTLCCRASAYNLVNKTNLVHNILSISSILFVTSTCFGTLQLAYKVFTNKCDTGNLSALIQC